MHVIKINTGWGRGCKKSDVRDRLYGAFVLPLAVTDDDDENDDDIDDDNLSVLKSYSRIIILYCVTQNP